MKHTAFAAALALGGVLAGCSGEKPLTNEEAVPLALEQTMGETPTAMLTDIAREFYPMFQIATGLGGEKGKEWDEARFNAELDASFAPLAPQIDQLFAAHVAAQMEEGEGQKLLDMLAEDRNAEFSQCVFTKDESDSSRRVERCVDKVGGTPDEEFLGALAKFKRNIDGAISGEDRLTIALSYAACSVLADFGEDVTRENFSIDLRTTKMGIGGNQRPCDEYDTLAAEQLTGDLAPNFAPEAETTE